MTPRNDALIGDIQEQFRKGRSRRWYALQMTAVALRSRRIQASLASAALLVAVASAGWWTTTRFAIPIALGFTFTSWHLWRMHRTMLVVLYAASVALMLPHWMMDMPISGGDQLFWAIARILAGYGVVGVLLVPFLILRLGRYGPLSEQPTSLSLG